MTHLVQKISDHVRQLIAPHACVHCGMHVVADEILCVPCASSLMPVATTTVSVTARMCMPVMAASEYADPLRSLVLAKRFSKRIASVQLARVIWQRTALYKMNIDALVPIPLHWSRYAVRGYNQAAVMAQELSRLSGVPVVHALERTRATAYQSELTSNARQKNVHNAFVVHKKNADQLAGAHILFVDDLMTTGSTLLAAGKAIRVCQPASLSAVVACRVP